MNKRDLIKKIDSTWLSTKRKTELKEAVNSFEDALLRQYAVTGRSEQLHLCPVCNEKAGKSYLLAKLPTICQKCDHAWNRA